MVLLSSKEIGLEKNSRNVPHGAMGARYFRQRKQPEHCVSTRYFQCPWLSIMGYKEGIQLQSELRLFGSGSITQYKGDIIDFRVSQAALAGLTTGCSR